MMSSSRLLPTGGKPGDPRGSSFLLGPVWCWSHPAGNFNSTNNKKNLDIHHTRTFPSKQYI